MQSHLIDQASKVIKNPQILINVISRRVCQLTNGHLPLVEVGPVTGHSDIALMEVIQKKIKLRGDGGIQRGVETGAHL